LDEFVELVGAVMFDVEFTVDSVVEGDSFVNVAKGFVDQKPYSMEKAYSSGAAKSIINPIFSSSTVNSFPTYCLVAFKRIKSIATG